VALCLSVCFFLRTCPCVRKVLVDVSSAIQLPSSFPSPCSTSLSIPSLLSVPSSSSSQTGRVRRESSSLAVFVFSMGSSSCHLLSLSLCSLTIFLLPFISFSTPKCPGHPFHLSPSVSSGTNFIPFFISLSPFSLLFPLLHFFFQQFQIPLRNPKLPKPKLLRSGYFLSLSLV
jgi:hypothetical protein